MAWYFSSEYKDFDAEIYWTPEDRRIDSEEERFYAVRRQLAKDIEAEYLATHSVISMDSPAFPSFDTSFGPSLLDGWRFPMPDTPYRSQLVKFETDIIDIVSTPFGSWALSERVINMVEKVEPGVHQYLPFEMLNPDGSVNPARRWILNICTRVQVIDIEKSNVMWMPPPLDFLFTDASNDRYLVVKGDEARRRAFWYEWQYTRSGYQTFVSDAVWDQLQSAGIKGWQPAYGYPDHIEEV